MKFRAFLRTFFFVLFVLLIAGGLFWWTTQEKEKEALSLLPSFISDVLPDTPPDFLDIRGIGNPPPLKEKEILTGKEKSSSEQERILAVMIEESSAARPLYRGIEKADILFEIPAEGGVPRFLALFSDLSFPQEIGPVRSSRSYFLDLAHIFSEAYAHAGGSPEALKRLSAGEVDFNIDEKKNDPRFLREKDIARPHNLFLLPNMVVEDIPFSKQKVPFFSYREDWNAPQGKSQESFTVSFSTRQHDVSYRYDSKQGCYKRKHALEKADLCFENVVILQTSIWLLPDDEKHRLGVKTTGEGDLFLFRDGTLYRGKWKRGESENFSFFDTSGEIFLKPGKSIFPFINSEEKLTLSPPSL